MAPAILSKPIIRRYGFHSLVILAAGMITAVVMVMTTDDPLPTEKDAFPEIVIVDSSRRPDIVFPESVRTYDLSLNRFVDRFARVCMEGRYSDLRLMLSSRSELVAKRFESMFNALKQVRILALERVPSVPGAQGPVYILKAQYVLEDHAAIRGRNTEDIRLAIAKEEGEWRIGSIPRELVAALEAYQQTTTQPAVEGPRAAEEPRAVAADEPPKAAANRPARVGG